LNRPTAKASIASVFPGWAPRGRLTAIPGKGKSRERVRGMDGWKRMADISASITGLVVFAPVMALTAVLVKLTSPGPVLFTQERIGVNRRTDKRRGASNGGAGFDRRRTDRRGEQKHGKPFKMFKFRSMGVGAENGVPKLTKRDDPRVTAFGRILRKTRIDETPQFLNVLRGDMSIVGPRPERDYFYLRMNGEIPQFPQRLMVKPGLTGLAQVNVGYCNNVKDMRRKLDQDLVYIRTLSPANDAKIMVRTVSVVLTGKGAF
jgi:lipopolysaccharide/colanic/teichoic acid biosynthesis glycosyltransferase